MKFFDAHYDMGGIISVKQGWIHPERTVDFNEIIYVVKGTVKLFEGDKKFELKSGDCLVLEKGKHHGGYEKNAKDAQFYWLHFYSDYDGFASMKYTNLSDSDIAHTLAHKLAYEAGTLTCPEIVSDSYMRLLLNEVYVASLQGTATAYPVCGTISEWITSNSYKKLDVEEVSRKFGYNKDYISRAFKRSFGMSLKSYIDTERMKFIKGLLLTTGYPLKQIALLAGFSDYKGFLKFFAYHSKETPMEFRQKYVN